MVMWWNLENVTLPIYNALECTCLSSGDQCFEAKEFDKPWWDNYWFKIIPGVFSEVDALKATVPGAAFYAATNSNAMDQSQALAYHQQLEAQVEKMAAGNIEMQKWIDTMTAQLATMPEQPATSDAAEITPKTKSTTVAPPAITTTKPVNATTQGNLNKTTVGKLNSSSLIEKKRALKHIKGSQRSMHHNLQ